MQPSARTTSSRRASWPMREVAVRTVSPEEFVPVYAALFVAAMGLDMTDVAIMIPGVRLADIRRASRLLEEDRSLRRANDAVVEFMLAQSIAKAWGEGFEASSDLMNLDVNRNLWLSRVDPKRRRHAVGTYTHVLDQWGIVYDQPLLLATRQAGAAIEGAVRQSITRLERLAVDTHEGELLLRDISFALQAVFEAARLERRANWLAAAGSQTGFGSLQIAI
jgi:hypothetical protein